MSFSNEIKTMFVSFQHPIKKTSIANWRGAFIEMSNGKDIKDDLLHNHSGNITGDESEYIYRYPKIQYRTSKGNAAIYAINEGIETLGKVLSQDEWIIKWNGDYKKLSIDKMITQNFQIQLFDKKKRYKVMRWIALSSENYKEWEMCNSFREKVQLIERLLVNHILACLWGIGWKETNNISVNLDLISRIQSYQLHGVSVLGFDATFSTNIDIPIGLAFGKGVSHGFGFTIPLDQN